MEIKFIDYLNEDLINVVVIVSKHQNQWLLCQHKQRNTLEFPGEKREKGENIIETAHRELKEETGAIDYYLEPLCYYQVINQNKSYYGLLCYADIQSYHTHLQHEINQIIISDTIPSNLTYPYELRSFVKEYQKRK